MKNKSNCYFLSIRSLDSNFHDRCDILLHASFQILVDFVEKEEPQESISWEAADEKKIWEEIQSLYEWWKNRNANVKNTEEDQVNLLRLVKIRLYLWT